MTYPFVILTVTIAVNLLLILLKVISCNRKCRESIKRQLRKIVWNSYIRLFIEEYLIITIAALIKMYALDFSTTFEAVSSCLAIVLMVTTILSPFVVRGFLYARFNMIS